MTKVLWIWIFASLIFHSVKLDIQLASFLYFNLNNILMFVVVSLYYGIRPCTVSLTVRNYCAVKILIELLMIQGIGSVGSWYYTVADMSIIFLSIMYGIFFKKYIRANG